MAIDSNMAGDLAALIIDIITTASVVVVCVISTSYLRKWFPLIYSYNALTGNVPFQPDDTFFGWLWAGWKITCSEAAQHAGLDQAMVIRYQEFCFKCLTFIGVPFVLILCPLHYRFGGNKAKEDNLSKIGVANDQDHIQIWWANALSVWYVVGVVQYFLFSYQRSFMARRFAWLKNMPEPRSKTALVTGIPLEYSTDERLKGYFNRMFGDDNAVQDAFVVKHTRSVRNLMDEFHGAKAALIAAKDQWRATGKDPNQRPSVWAGWSSEDAIAYWTSEVKRLREECRASREELKRKSEAVAARFDTLSGDGERAQFKQFLSKLDEGYLEQYMSTEGIVPNTTSAFVTFKSRHLKEMAMNLTFRADAEELNCQVPPEPGDVVYKSFMNDEASKKVSYLIGYLLILSSFALFMPFVMEVAMYTNVEFLAERFALAAKVRDDYPLAAETFTGLVCSLCIDMFMSCIPTALSLVVWLFWEPQANAHLQVHIQKWYFAFLVTFVLLVTGVGNSIYETLTQLAHVPMEALDFFFSAMPRATHFYMNYVVVNNGRQAMVLTRYINLAKYLGFRIFLDVDTSRQLSEPEDQDYLGIGSRCAQFSLLFAICLVYSTLAPLITVLGMLYFGLNRLYYGYLLVFAETRKPDLGGEFWQTQMKHVQVSVYIYIGLMCGVCSARGPSWMCGLIPFSAGVFHVFSCMRFDSFRWYSLPFEAEIFLCGEEGEPGSPVSAAATSKVQEAYCQPELHEDLDDGCEEDSDAEEGLRFAVQETATEAQA